MVRLLLIIAELADEDGTGFNPTVVRLLLASGAFSRFLTQCFNPTMVRLLHAHEEGTLRSSVKFQSHNGAIAANGLDRIRYLHEIISIPQWCDCCLAKKGLILPTLHFNPTMVRLLRKRERSRLPASKHFNPTMVRLLLTRSDTPIDAPQPFQSHNGAIAAQIP